ncbi:MAG: hypothetical protein P8170_25090, partial [Gemmatimonadota bacterium]
MSSDGARPDRIGAYTILGVLGEAERLIDFMLGDLRGKLEPIGRLDLLDDVGGEAVAYFAEL